jgi:GTP-binding protein of the ras superfamily involved in termination of M-phase
MEKTISLKKGDITFSIWDLGGQQEFTHMLPLVCNEAVAILFLFDLSRKSTLVSVKQWYKQARKLNKRAIPFLIGTKYDYFDALDAKEKDTITKQARKFAKAMKAPLIFCSASEGINVKAIFKVVLCKVFNINCSVEPISGDGDPILEY